MFKIIYTIVIIAMFTPLVSNAQCKSFTKKKCAPELGEYTFNGQLNTAILTRGEEAELMLSFYSNQKYRLFVCSEEQLGDVNYEILNMERNTIYSSEGKDSKIFDFKVPSTQQLILRVKTPGKRTKHNLEFRGCVSVLIGFLEEESDVSKDKK